MSVLLTVAAAAPFIPAIMQFVRRGVPDVLFSGDGATLELRVLFASRGTQLLGPYSRFPWSHPGPTVFYLAAPLYAAFQRHGPALNLFALVANLLCAIGTVLSAGRLCGGASASALAALLAMYESAGPDFQLTGEWNPVVPILPLGLFTLLSARVARGAVWPLPVAAFVASFIVQTHIGYLPVVLATAAITALLRVEGFLAAPRQPVVDAAPRVDRAIRATVTVLVLAWLPPLLESARHHGGNARRLLAFFGDSPAPEHAWRAVLATVAAQLTVAPVALLRTVGFDVHLGSAASLGYGTSLALALLWTAALSRRRGDPTSTVLAILALGQIGASAFAVRAIRGEVHPYLVIWISMVGLMALFALASAKLRTMSSGGTRRRMPPALAIVVIALVGLAARKEAARVDVFRERDPQIESLAAQVERSLALERADRPTLRVAASSAWPAAAAVVLSLTKHDVPIYVERAWLFMMGYQLAAPPAGKGPRSRELVIADDGSCEVPRVDHGVHAIARAGALCAFLTDPEPPAPDGAPSGRSGY